MRLTRNELDMLRALAKTNDPAFSKDPVIAAALKSLSNKKMVRPQTFLDGSSRVGSPRIMVAYQITAAGRKAVGTENKQ